MGSLGPSIDPDAASSLRTAYAKAVHYHHLLNKYKERHPEATSLPPVQFAIPKPEELESHRLHEKTPSRDDRICIIGAGAAGLNTALLMQNAGFHNIDIIEASDKPGGSMFTHVFPEDPSCAHNYCDIGAMRLPEIKRMEATFKLIEKLGLNDKLKPYIYTIPDDKKPQEPNLWGFKDKPVDSKRFTEAMTNFFTADGGRYNFLEDFGDAFNNFIADGLDTLSTRGWLMTHAGFTFDETVKAESSDTSTGLFDQAMLETICDYVDFAAAENKPWHRLEGGMQVITEAMVKKVLAVEGTTIRYSSPVVALRDNQEEKTITVRTRDSRSETYLAVFSTTAMPCLQRMDLSELGLPEEILTGIRVLSYDRATKVAIKFSRPWWRNYLKNSTGGVSSTDLPISKIVYPSWDDGADNPAVLLASYSWSQDATRMGAMFTNSRPDDKPDRDADVVTLCLENIAQVWAGTPTIENPPSVEELRAMYLDHFAYAWSHDKFQGGAYALFGPGQFSYIYPRFLELQCEKKFVIVGEAFSAEHAWISGALDSSYQGVTRWLCQNGYKHACAHVKASGFGGGKGKHPEEMDEQLLFWSMKLGEGWEGKSTF